MLIGAGTHVWKGRESALTSVVLPIEVRLVELASGEVIEGQAETDKPEARIKGMIRSPVFA